MRNIYETGLDKNAANYVPLSPISLLRRAAHVHPSQLAVVHGPVRRTWGETAERCRRLAAALKSADIQKGDTVTILAPNIPEMLEAHFGVLMSGAVLNALNVRLDAAGIAFILEHAETKLALVDRAFSGVFEKALAQLANPPRVISIDDPTEPSGYLLGPTYEELLESGRPEADAAWPMPDDEWDACCLNYTSGTTGNPKGVVYSHRGAYLNAIANAVNWAMPPHPTYLWTLPMFHCNGWCFPWTVTALAGTHVCLRQVAAKPIYDAIADHGVTHLCGAPIVMSLIANAPEADRRPLPHSVKMMTAGAAPPAAVLEATERAGFDVTHVYGLTEVYGPAAICDWHDEWNALPADEKANLKARQGVNYIMQEEMTVLDPVTLAPVPRNGQTMGEIMFRGNITMKGYLKNPTATHDAFAGGWFHSGDLAVVHPDGYVEIRDRSKDVIISGGENISTIEVEGVLYRHPAVLEAAVVAKPDEKWGETPCAFITLRPGTAATAQEIIQFCRENLAHYKCPRTIVFRELPKTSTGKVQKYRLRELAKEA